MKIVFRADSSSVIGAGHVMRCLVLADELKSDVIFACRNLQGNIISVIEARGYKVINLSETLADANTEFLIFLKKELPEVLIIDNYDTDIELENKAREYVGHIVVIDDIANRKHNPDILLDQNPCPATHARYTNLVPKAALKLLGLEYALLGREFLKYRKSLTSTNMELKNILIFFGGGDHKNLTEKTIEALIGSSAYQDIQFNVVVGSSNPNKDKIQKLCESTKNFKFHCQINNMAELMAQADLFIGAGGTTSWERMCVGLPGIIISIAENQAPSCLELAKMDVIKYLGAAEEFIDEKLLNSFIWISEHPEWYKAATTKGQKMVDGLGAKRVAEKITSLLEKIQ